MGPQDGHCLDRSYKRAMALALGAGKCGLASMHDVGCGYFALSPRVSCACARGGAPRSRSRVAFAMRIKAALIVDNLSLMNWQKAALLEALSCLDIRLILNCRNTRTEREIRGHFVYYMLSHISSKSELTRRVALSLHDAATLSFDSTYEGDYHVVPAEISERVKKQEVKLVIKFGMDLLKIDDGLAGLDILSFRHGDPRDFRGPAAGFHELYESADRIGTVVEKLGDGSDRGEILAICHSKIHHHSYRRTVANVHRNSRHLLRKAIVSYTRGERITLGQLGPDRPLPSNAAALLLAVKLVYRTAARLFYGAFFEKRWNIVKLKFESLSTLSRISRRDGSTPRIPDAYTFYADPFFSADGRLIRAEALNAKNGLGEIVEIDSTTLVSRGAILHGAHYSYPYSFEERGEEYLVPEVASHSAPCMVRLPVIGNARLLLDGLGDKRLVDGSLIKHKGIYYLFAGNSESSADALYLYSSKQLFGPYVGHPQNPIVLDPSCARMAGRVYCSADKIYRFGQNNSFSYGNGITINQIVDLTETTYVERIIGAIAFADARGPHTLDINGNSAVLDFYVDKFSLVAGYRRLAAKARSFSTRGRTSADSRKPDFLRRVGHASGDT